MSFHVNLTNRYHRGRELQNGYFFDSTTNLKKKSQVTFFSKTSTFCFRPFRTFRLRAALKNDHFPYSEGLPNKTS
jgi:hypothetical protein